MMLDMKTKRTYQERISEMARKRRMRFYQQHLKGKTATELAEKAGVTHQCMSYMIRRAKDEVEK